MEIINKRGGKKKGKKKKKKKRRKEERRENERAFNFLREEGNGTRTFRRTRVRSNEIK